MNIFTDAFCAFSLLFAVCDVYELNWERDYLELCHYPPAFNPIGNKAALIPPMVEKGRPARGKRTRIYMKEYPFAPYSLFLPYNFSSDRLWPVIFEVPGNPCLPDTTMLGYGLTKGMDYIWVSVPYVDEEGKLLRGYWGDDPTTTVDYWLHVLDDLNNRFPINNDKIVIAGFSLGAAAVSSFGNWDERISVKWAGYFAQSHFDGCCQTCPGDPNERIARINDRKTLIVVGEEDIALPCSCQSYTKLVERGVPATYLELPGWNHFMEWILEDSAEAEAARSWLHSL